jgi:hypothetical protein
MVGREKFCTFEFGKNTPDTCNPFIDTEEGVIGVFPQGADDAGLYGLQLSEKIFLAAFYFLRLRISIIGRPALQDVADENIFPLQTRPLYELIEKLPGPADERSSLGVFFLARCFPYKKQFRMFASLTKDDRPPCLAEIAPSARLDGLLELRQISINALFRHVLLYAHVPESGQKSFWIGCIHQQ